MKINKVNHLSTNNTVNKGSQNEKANSSKSEGLDDVQANVHLSSTYSNLSDTATTNSVLNLSKIAEIKQAMAEGRFKVKTWAMVLDYIINVNNKIDNLPEPPKFDIEKMKSEIKEEVIPKDAESLLF